MKTITNHTLIAVYLFPIVLMLGTGCAYTPQEANINPNLNIASSEIGGGRVIAFRILDERPSQDLGRRGTGVIQGAKISTSEDIVEVVREKIEEGFNAKGFTVVEYNKEQPLRMDIELRLLEYSTSVGFWTGGVHVKGAMKAEVFNYTDEYENFYRVEEEKRVVVVPGAGFNEKMINETLKDLLELLFKDPELFDFLARDYLPM